MEFSSINYALILSIQLALPLLIAALVGSIIAGVFRVATQIDEELISLISKTLFAGIALYLISGSISNNLIDFTKSIWANVESYQ